MADYITLPGLIDPHVHLRDPGQTHKEDFYSGTSAALAGGFTTVLDMPNNAEPITTPERLEKKLASARSQIVADVGLHYGTLGNNFESFPQVINQVTGLKVYMNVTTGNFKIDASKLIEIYKAWPATKPILLHAEDDVSEIVLETLRAVQSPTHICHISSRAELEFVMQAKSEGLPITCGVTPHHLFLNEDDAVRLGSYGHMKPYLKSQADVDFLWANLNHIDIIESDHAPHTRAEKDSETPPFGVPGLETTLPLMLTAERDGKLKREKLLDLLHHRAAQIFHIPVDPTTKVQVEMIDYKIVNESLLTRAGWSPFAGRSVVGRVKQVYLHGVTVFRDGQVLSQPGSARLIN